MFLEKALYVFGKGSACNRDLGWGIEKGCAKGFDTTLWMECGATGCLERACAAGAVVGGAVVRCASLAVCGGVAARGGVLEATVAGAIGAVLVARACLALAGAGVLCGARGGVSGSLLVGSGLARSISRTVGTLCVFRLLVWPLLRALVVARFLIRPLIGAVVRRTVVVVSGSIRRSAVGRAHRSGPMGAGDASQGAHHGRTAVEVAVGAMV